MKAAAALAAPLLIACLLTVSVGVRPAGPLDLWRALSAFDPADPVHITLVSIRLPRLAAGLVGGAGLGMAGLVMQALTRNPLADPGVLGVNAGAAFSVVFGALAFGRSDGGLIAWLAFPGAMAASLGVFAIGGGLKGDIDPVRLTLAGIAMNALLLSLVSALVLTRTDSLDTYRFWVAGSLAQAERRPILAMGLVGSGAAGLAVALAPAIETLSLGTTLARGLGTRIVGVQAGALLVIALLTGAAVAVAGPVAFLGLMVPPLANRAAGQRLRGGLLAAAAIGATILLLADTAGRLLIAPAEVRVGVMTALAGGPIFVWIARGLQGRRAA